MNVWMLVVCFLFKIHYMYLAMAFDVHMHTRICVCVCVSWRSLSSFTCYFSGMGDCDRFMWYKCWVWMHVDFKYGHLLTTFLLSPQNHYGPSELFMSSIECLSWFMNQVWVCASICKHLLLFFFSFLLQRELVEFSFHLLLPFQTISFSVSKIYSLICTYPKKEVKTYTHLQNIRKMEWWGNEGSLFSLNLEFIISP